MISKPDFCNLLSAIKEQTDEDLSFAESASAYFGGRVGGAQNVHLISAIVRYLDSLTECCNYVHCWVFEKNFGRNKGITEMAFELMGITTNEELYDFIIKKQK